MYNLTITLLLVGGTWIFADGVASLYIYTDGKKGKGQTFWRDHFFRVIRALLGLAFILMGILLFE